MNAAEGEWRELAERGTQALQEAKDLQQQLQCPVEQTQADLLTGTMSMRDQGSAEMTCRQQQSDSGALPWRRTASSTLLGAQECMLTAHRSCSDATTSDDENASCTFEQGSDACLAPDPRLESPAEEATQVSTSAPMTLQHLDDNLGRLEQLLQFNYEVQQLKSSRWIGGTTHSAERQPCPARSPAICTAARDSSSGAHSEAVTAPLQAAAVERKLTHRMGEAEHPDPEVYLGHFDTEPTHDSPALSANTPAPLGRLAASLRARLPVLRRRAAELERCAACLLNWMRAEFAFNVRACRKLLGAEFGPLRLLRCDASCH